MMKKIDISILGLGNLGTAFFEGLRKNSNVNLHLYEENEGTRKSLLKLYDTKILPNIEFIDSGILILCIKPQNIRDFFESSSNKIGENVLICSPVAGLEIETINQYVENKIIRIMPNLLIRENNGLIPFVKNYDGDYLKFINVALSFLGNTEEFDEELFALITAISGSGPAWFYELSNQLVNSATKLGMNENDATNFILSKYFFGNFIIILFSFRSRKTLIKSFSKIKKKLLPNRFFILFSIFFSRNVFSTFSGT